MLLDVAREEGSQLRAPTIDVDALKTINDMGWHVPATTCSGPGLRYGRPTCGGRSRISTGCDEFRRAAPGSDADGGTVHRGPVLAADLERRPWPRCTLLGDDRSLGLSRSRARTRRAARSPRPRRAHAGKRARAGRSSNHSTRRSTGCQDARACGARGGGPPDRDQGSLRPVYQPIYSLRTGAVIGYEGLVRLAEQAGFDSPSSLFIAAEATRRTVELDIVCARTVLAGALALMPGDTCRSICHPARRLDAFSPLEILAMARLIVERRPDQLVIELTEREAIEDLDRLQRASACCVVTACGPPSTTSGPATPACVPERGRFRHDEDRPVARPRRRDA